MAFTFTWETFPPALRETFKAFRTPGVGWKLIGEDNIFVEKVIPGGVVRQLSEEEMNQYRMPFLTIESRLAGDAFKFLIVFMNEVGPPRSILLIQL